MSFCRRFAFLWQSSSGIRLTRARPRLSFCAKLGLSLSTRAALGHHRNSSLVGSTSVRSYSRDAQAGPVAELTELIQAVGEGLLDPDSPRGLRGLQTTRKETLLAKARRGARGEEGKEKEEEEERLLGGAVQGGAASSGDL